MAEPLYMRILRALGAEIAHGTLRPGDRLMENRLAHRFGVSRAPARQALGEMASLGLVAPAAAPARGYVVTADAAARAAPYAQPTSDCFTGETTPSWQRIYGDVENALTRRIAFGSWRLVESALGQHFGVSRTVAREVLARLQSRGLVINEGKRWIAPELTERRVRDLYELRALLEPAALIEVAATAPRAQLDRMCTELRRAQTHGTAGPSLDQLEADLHFDLLGQCRNTLLRKTMIESQSLLLAHRFIYQHTAEMYPVEPFLQEHLAVLEALRNGALAEACDELRWHLRASSDRALLRIAALRQTFRAPPLAYFEPI